MLQYALTRLAEFLPVLFLFLVLIFVIVHAAPGDPITYVYGPHVASAEALEQLRALYGLDEPLPAQFARYVWRLLHGDLGRSVIGGHPVLGVILTHIPPTLLLMGTATVLAVSSGVLFGALAAHRPHSMLDIALTVGSLLGYSLPTFLLGLLLIMLLSVTVPVFPTLGMTTLGAQYAGLRHVLDVLHHLVLPAIVLASWYLAIYARMTRVSLLAALREPYIATARAKGLSEVRVVFHHGLRNALLPVVTNLGLQLGSTITGGIITETLFAWPGMGYLTYTALLQRDYPLLIGIFLISSACVLLMNLMTDLAYAHLDPRIRF
ncbi:MAG: ABC transporter permease [Candidatus Rokubacteria bacterium]|nr:ABC transporter permease [Candidatus Rokubacteria bacterium]